LLFLYTLHEKRNGASSFFFLIPYSL
jgi:hypothetical protein